MLWSFWLLIIPKPGVTFRLSFTVGSRPCSEDFPPGPPVFVPPQKPNSKFQFALEFPKSLVFIYYILSLGSNFERQKSNLQCAFSDNFWFFFLILSATWSQWHKLRKHYSHRGKRNLTKVKFNQMSNSYLFVNVFICSCMYNYFFIHVMFRQGTVCPARSMCQC